MNFKSAALMSCLALAPISQSHAQESSNYNGWTLGVSAGWVGSVVKFNNGFSTFATANNKPQFNQTIYGIHADWIQTQANDMVVGLGFAAGYHASNPRKTLVNGASSSNGFVTTGAVSLREKRKFFTEVTARAGMNLGNAIVYALASVKGTNIEYQTNVANNGTFNYNRANVLKGSQRKSYYAWGIAPGLGFDFMVDQEWSFGLEYRYFFEMSKKLLNNTVKVKPNSHNLLARFSYHF